MAHISVSCDQKVPRHSRSRQTSPKSPISPPLPHATTSTDPSSPTEKIYYCTTCSYKTIRKRDRNRHIRSVHTRETPYLCEACDMGFVRSDARARHWKKVALCRELHEEMVRLGLKK
ncbi:hypothetical protein CPB86DRAFT_716172 [Serendipita vermifera]|nr:hypothetical protein CPB86DRAFT_716172 [Serendipita vermifera]